MRLVMPSARPKFDTSTVAPCSCAMRATAKPIELSIVDAGDEDPLALENAHAVVLLGVVGRCSSGAVLGGGSVAHAEAAVDRDDRAGDVRRASEPSHCTTDATSSTVA